MNKKLLRRVAVIALPGGTAVGAGTAIAASGPNDSAVIHACVTKAGTFRNVEAVATCKKGETPLSWTQQGLERVPGSPVPAGPAGASDANNVGGDPLQG